MLIKNPITNVSIGTDPECFIINTKTNKVKSAVKMIPGTKDEPHLIDELGQGFALQTDNILAEFNVPPTKNCEDFVDNINLMKEYIRNFVKSVDEKYDILCAASQIVPKSELRSKQAKEFGCDPDYCVYTRDQNPKPDKEATEQRRSAGFHVHVSYDRPTIDRSLQLMYYLDAYLGLPSIIIDRDDQRRKLYGKAGCFRLCSYGVEYRTLSSYFMKDDEHLKWVFRQTSKAIDAYNTKKPIPKPEIVRSTIDNNDIDRAYMLCQDYSICDNFLDN